MRLPNGYGSIVKLSGNRRKPFMIRKTIDYKPNGSPIYKIIGYTTTKEDALYKLALYNATPQPKPILTFAAVYSKWLHTHINTVSTSTIKSYKSAYKHCEPIKGKAISQIKYQDLQALLDTIRANGLSYSTAKKVRTLLSLVFSHAYICEYITKNPCHHLKIGHNHSVRPHKPFSRRAINKLWQSECIHKNIALILLYTGMRSKELRTLKRKNVDLKRKLIQITESKTNSGIRIIPIHSRIFPIIESLCQEKSTYLLGKKYTYNQLASAFNQAMQSIGYTHTTHDCRHTFATILDNKGANCIAKRKLLGHAHGDITDKVYTHKGIRELRKAIELLP